jgi:uncharacterized protein
MSKVSSPCTGACKLTLDTCSGCGRTLEEIATWSCLSDESKQGIIDRLNKKQMFIPYTSFTKEHHADFSRVFDIAGEALGSSNRTIHLENDKVNIRQNNRPFATYTVLGAADLPYPTGETGLVFYLQDDTETFLVLIHSALSLVQLVQLDS